MQKLPNHFCDKPCEMNFKINIVGDSGKPCMQYIQYYHNIINYVTYCFLYNTGVGKTTMLLRLVKPEFMFGGIG